MQENHDKKSLKQKNTHTESEISFLQFKDCPGYFAWTQEYFLLKHYAFLHTTTS